MIVLSILLQRDKFISEIRLIDNACWFWLLSRVHTVNEQLSA